MSDTVAAGAAPNRRALIKAASAGLALAAGASGAAHAKAARVRYAIVGVGSRSRMYQEAITGPYRDQAELVAVCDVNPGRLALAQRRALEAGAAKPVAYAPDQFETMIRAAKVEVVIVTTVDATHDDYIVRAMEAGCDVITEKPMTTTAAKARRILEAQARTGRHIRVTFNYRYSPPRTQVKDILMSGEIGDVLSVDFHWLLNTTHGADYFRRWHSRKAMSGGLMVHKATHHFDLVNWWLSAQPTTVYALGKREFYTPAMARRLGLSGPHQRCRTCPETVACSFFLDITADRGLKALYADNEGFDGYFRDQCVWRPEIDIEDTMNVVVGYDTGATLSYSLNACNAWEGYQIAFNGTKGRLEHGMVEQIYVAGGDMIQGGVDDDGVTIRVIPLRGAVREVTPWKASGGHGGGDKLLLDDIFLRDAPADKYLRTTDQRGGAASIAVGVAANQSMASGQPVKIADLMPDLPRPAMPPMPGRTDPVPMPRAPRKA